jgi:hypothetical protein
VTNCSRCWPNWRESNEDPSTLPRLSGRGGALCRAAQCGPRKQACGIQRGQWRIRIVHDQRDLGAAEHDGVAALVLHPSDHALEVGDGVEFEHAADQLIHDDAVDLFAFGGVRAYMLQSARGELF